MSQWDDLRVFIDWAAARWTASQRFDSPPDFYSHLYAISVEQPNALARYGYPGVEWYDPAPPALARIPTRYGPVTEPANGAIQVAWPEALWVNAAEISYLESSWRPTARNNTLHMGPCGTQYYIPGIGPAMTEDSIGLFQVNRCAHGGTVEELSDPVYNADKGYQIYLSQGWGAWWYSATALGLI